MGKGRVYGDRPFRYRDSHSGREVRRLTDYLGHSSHLYFTDLGWFNGGRSLIFTSDRENQSNLFRYDLDTATITQLTDLRGPGRPSGYFSAANRRHYYWWQGVAYELDPDSLAERPVGEAPPGMTVRSRGAPTADGRYLVSLVMAAPPAERPTVEYAYSRFREFFLARPRSQILRIEIATGRREVLHEDRRYLGQVNPSPTRPELLTFCHEGPWEEVEQRIWGLNIATGATWPIRPQAGEDLAVGHEYWFADGERIGYHGRPRSGGGEHVFGHLRWDNGEHVEVRFPFHSTHFHSLDERLIVGDGTPAAVFGDFDAQPFIQLFKWDGGRYVGPRVLAYHRSTFNDQHAHCHPQFTPDGRAVLYTSDLTGYANLYLVEVGDFEALPPLG